MIPTSIIGAYVIAFIMTFVVPVVLVIILGIRHKIDLVALGMGFASFFVSQILLRIPLLKFAGTQQWFLSFTTHKFVYLLFLCLTAGLFEESGRLCGGLLLKKHRSYRAVLSFGLGHAFCEMILLVGLTHLSNLILAISFNEGGTLASRLSPSVAQQTKDALMLATPSMISAGILERVSATFFHLFATTLVFIGIVRHKIGWYFLAIGAHTGFDLLAVFTSKIGIWPTELLLFTLSLVGLWFVWTSRNRFVPAHAKVN